MAFKYTKNNNQEMTIRGAAEVSVKTVKISIYKLNID